MDELDHQKIIKKIIYNELEPSVLNEQVITKAILDQGPEGEAGRLFRSTEIRYDKITVLRLEFLNILKIDNLWILPNLQVLSLAFNKIDKIENLEALGELKELNLTYNLIDKLENLEALKSLEVLSVFGNKLTMIENVDRLDSLIIFSAGNNLISTKDGIERLRFLKKLRSLNLKGNAVEKSEKFFRIYIAGLLPHLTYYENKHISKEERDEGKDRFRFKLREIMDNEKAEVQERERVVHDKEESIHLAKCFVEHFDKDQLFDSLFVFDNEEQGECLLKIGGEEKNLVSEFHDQSFVITQKIYKIGLEQFEKRNAEHKIFMNCVTVGKKRIQIEGQTTVNNFYQKSEEIYEKFRETYTKRIDNEELNKEVAELTEEFNKLHDETWKSLMESEMHLHESVVESNTTFEHVIQDMMNEFIEKCKSQFVQLREVESNFVDALSEATQSFVTTLASTGKENEIPDELRSSLIDRDVINNLASGMKELQMQKVDGREDVLVSRGKKWVEVLCDQMMLNEIERNRQKVMEINFFLDNQQINFDNLTTDMRSNPSYRFDETDNESKDDDNTSDAVSTVAIAEPDISVPEKNINQ